MKTIILTYYVSTAGMTGEEAFKFCEALKESNKEQIAALRAAETESHVMVQYLPICEGEGRFQVDTF